MAEPAEWMDPVGEVKNFGGRLILSYARNKNVGRKKGYQATFRVDAVVAVNHLGEPLRVDVDVVGLVRLQLPIEEGGIRAEFSLSGQNPLLLIGKVTLGDGELRCDFRLLPGSGRRALADQPISHMLGYGTVTLAEHPSL